MRPGTDIAIEAADYVLMRGSLQGVLTALDLSGVVLSRRPAARYNTDSEPPQRCWLPRAMPVAYDPDVLTWFPTLTALYDLSGATFRRIRLNYLWAFGYNMVMIPIAAGALYAPVRLQLPPWVAGALPRPRSDRQ